MLVKKDSVQSLNDIFYEPDENSSAVDHAVHHLLNRPLIENMMPCSILGGFITKKMVAKMKCPECATALYQLSNQDHVLQCKTTLLSFKAYDNLFVPSSSLYRVVHTIDKLAREMLVN